MNASRILTIAGFAMGLATVLVQYGIHINKQMDLGRSLAGALVHYWSYFTIWTNTFLTLVFASALFTSVSGLSLFRRPITRATALASILVVMIVYHLLLSATHNPVGVEAITNIVMHTILPLLYPIWWFLTGRDRTLWWPNLPWLLVYPAVYLVWTYSRAFIIREYPYDFLNIETNGIAGVSPIIIAIVVLILIFGAIMVLIDKRKVPNP
ncbi:MAG: Pr6Pr family membrane protein [Pseudomonadota bacterium]